MAWEIILILIVAVLVACGGVYWFIKLPKEMKIANVQEWLKWGVIEAEKKLGSGTGQLKLRLVYNMAVEKFPWIVSLITFEDFSKLVDIALEWMNKQLESNENAQNYVKE